MTVPLTTQAALIIGGGELGTAVGHALSQAGLSILVVDRPLPSALRLRVAFATAAVEGSITVDGVEAVHCTDAEAIRAAWVKAQVAVWTRPDPPPIRPALLVDARLRALTEPLAHLDPEVGVAPLVIGIGPGFEVGRDCHLVIESQRGPRLGEVIESGSAAPHTGTPGEVQGYSELRVLRSPRRGVFERAASLGDFVAAGESVGEVSGQPVVARLSGMIRGLKLTGVPVGQGHKVGDIDPRRDRSLLRTMTDKARAIGRGARRAAWLAGLLPAVPAPLTEPEKTSIEEAMK